MKINQFDMHRDLERILIPEARLKQRIQELGRLLTQDYKGKCPVVVGILRGVVPFYAAVTECMDTPIEEDFMSVSSYSGTESTGKLNIRKDLDIDIQGRDVLILEDILDSGFTLKEVTKMLWERKPNSIKICTLMDKPEGRKVELQADYVGFEVPNAFVVGFGLDYNNLYRNLPYVGVLKPQVYQD